MTQLTHEDLYKELKKNHYRIAVFGSARYKPDEQYYKEAYDLGKQVGERGFDIVTGGGPGIMEAANAGHKIGNKDNNCHSIGLTIRLPFENEPNEYLDLHKHFDNFSERLDTFMILSQVLVVMPGGIGTCLELFYSWQLTQVKHICSIPIVLHGSMWENLVKWIKDNPLHGGTISQHDLHNIHLARDMEHVLDIIDQFHKVFEEEGENFCLNYKKYKIV